MTWHQCTCSHFITISYSSCLPTFMTRVLFSLLCPSNASSLVIVIQFKLQGMGWDLWCQLYNLLCKFKCHGVKWSCMLLYLKVGQTIFKDIITLNNTTLKERQLVFSFVFIVTIWPLITYLILYRKIWRGWAGVAERWKKMENEKKNWKRYDVHKENPI